MEPPKNKSQCSIMVMLIKRILFTLSSLAFSSWDRLWSLNLFWNFIKLNAQIEFKNESVMKTFLMKLLNNKMNDWFEECLLGTKTRRHMIFDKLTIKQVNSQRHNIGCKIDRTSCKYIFYPYRNFIQFALAIAN